ncbi:hypothetical protein VTJ83DRAFT_7173 [Remersonia thermophila]|uniref:SH3 domain-containing protein n=1 Tax=Remersonia thermophila TaxID=72144 RepID=A0ABR4D2V9_9PEZI
MGLHNPLPSSLASECRKCAKILSSFIDPRQAFGPDKVIPPSVLANAKGLAILTVVKAGFLGSARFGSGLVVARLPNGKWSAPSAIATGGAGFGGQIGFELTDFVFILNDASAVKTFSQAGSLTLGGNVSIAAGPVGRNAEAAGAASLRSVAGIFSYSKTRGLFAGVSLEGSAIIERKDANAKMYSRHISARELLQGAVPPPPEADPLLVVLNSRIFLGQGGVSAPGVMDDRMYNDIPIYDDDRDEVVWGNRSAQQPRDEYGRPRRSSTWQDDIYDPPSSRGLGSGGGGGFGGGGGYASRAATFYDGDLAAAAAAKPKKAAPSRPTAPKPAYKAKDDLPQVVAKFDFTAEQEGDLGFKKGDVITVLKKTDSTNDWWTGRIGLRTGIFPSNYVKPLE